MSGTIAVLTGELARYTEFARTLLRIDRPEGTALDWVVTNDIGRGRNLAVANFLRTEGQWLWFIDDDMIPEQQTLMRLIATPTEIVQPLVLSRRPPFMPTMYKRNDLTGLYHAQPLTPDMSLVPVDACGTGGMLIRRHVLEKLQEEPDPWFEVGQIQSDALGEDLFFCYKAKQLGFTVHVDTTIPMGHMTPAEIWPSRPDGNWMTEVRIGNSTLAIDAAS